MNRYERCACHSKIPYHKCCMPLHDGAAAPNALALMRSRYSAYAYGLIDYLMDTTHPENADYRTDRIPWAKDILLFSKNTRFDGLKIVEFVDGEETAFVEFRALLRQNETEVTLSERSKFLRTNGRWLYHSGAVSTE